MDIPRRKFFQSTIAFTAVSCMAPSLSLSSCLRAGKAGWVRMGFIGSEEHFKYYQPVFQKLKDTSVEITSLDEALISNLHAIFIDSQPSIKAAQIMLLLEQYKDIFTPYPLANNLNEYGRVQAFLDQYNRKLGMLNPLHFYPSAGALKEWLADRIHDLTDIHVSCHPYHLVHDYHVKGYAGTVALLQQMISFFTGQFPYSLYIENRAKNGIQHWMLDYDSFKATFQADPGQTGWILRLDGTSISAITDHTGLLRLNDEVEPTLSPSPSVWEKSMIRNLEDFVQSVRSRTGPTVNSLDGLSAIILNQAAEKSMQSGKRINL